MMNSNIKKLATTFLAITVIASSLTLGLSAFVNRPRVDQNKNAGNKAGAEVRGLIPGDTNRISGGGPNGQNLTDEAVSIFARQLVARNPEGPKMDSGVAKVLIPTSTEAIAAYLKENPASENVLATSFDASRIKVIEHFNQGDLSHYLSAVADIQDAIGSNPVWQASLKSSASSSDAGTINWATETWKAIADARESLYDTQVPAPFLSFHKTLLAFFSTNASYLSVASQDPMAALALSDRMSVILAQQTSDLDRSVKELQPQLSALDSSLPSRERTALMKMFGVSVAYAQGVATDDNRHILTTIAQWAKDFWYKYGDQIKSYALGFLKEALIPKLQQKVIKWARGEGVPGFVINWVSFQAGAALAASTGMISRETAELCGNAATQGLYGDIIASALGGSGFESAGGAQDASTVGDSPDCPNIYQAISGEDSTQGFQSNSFQLGDFVVSLTNNPWNDLMKIRDNALASAGNALEGAVNEALSGRGSLDVKKCDDESTPDEEGLCEDGNPARVVTPGSVKQDLVSQFVGTIENLVASINNEYSFEGVIEAAEKFLLSAIFNEAEGLYGDFSNSNPRNPAPPGNGASLQEKLAWYGTTLEKALSDTNAAVSNYNQAVNALQGSLNYCSEDIANQIQDLINGFKETTDDLKEEVTEIQGLLSIVNSFKQNPTAHTQAELDSSVGTTDEITDLAAEAADNRAQARTDTDNANSLFQSCPAP